MTVAWICVIQLGTAMWCASPASTATAQTVEGRSIDGTWVGISDGGSLLIERQGQRVSLDIPDLLSISWPITAPPSESAPPSPGAAPASVGGLASSPAQGATPASVRGRASSAPEPSDTPHARPVRVFLRDGSEILGHLTSGDSRTISIETAMLPRLTLPLTQVAAVRFTAMRQPEAEAAFDRAMTDKDISQDVLIIAGDGKAQVLRGVIESLEPAGGSFRWRERAIPIPTDRAAGVVLAAATAGVSAKFPAACHLDDGSIWCGTISAGDRDSITLKLGIGESIRLPLRELREIRFVSDKVTFLSDLEPAKVEFEPFGSTQWYWRRDRSVTNRPLRIAGQAFTRGIGVHSKTILTYTLDGRATRLAATIGIDDNARPQGNVVFRVIADGKEVFSSGPVTGRDAPRPILVPLQNTRLLQLIVDFGEDLDLGDQANWCNVRVIR